MSANGKTKLLSPQQELFLAEYTNPKSVNFGNAKQSALKAGYSEEYSQNITGQLPEWLSENMNDLKRLRKAEKVLDETLDMDTVNKKNIGDVVVEFNDTQLLKIKQDTAKFIAEKLGKNKYSSRNELTGKDGEKLENIVVLPKNILDKLDDIIQQQEKEI